MLRSQTANGGCHPLHMFLTPQIAAPAKYFTPIDTTQCPVFMLLCIIGEAVLSLSRRLEARR